jgi:hypothetical protein
MTLDGIQGVNPKAEFPKPIEIRTGAYLFGEPTSCLSKSPGYRRSDYLSRRPAETVTARPSARRLRPATTPGTP